MNDKKPMDFQLATAKRIAEIFASGKQSRILLADEVGLGKTIVAKTVIAELSARKRLQNTRPLRVAYVCSNLNIIKQNINNLGIYVPDNITVESRLSMQHLVLQEKERDVSDVGSELLIPLTPGTSFSFQKQKSSPGNMQERAYMYVMLREYFGASKALNEIFKTPFVRKYESWDNAVKVYENRVRPLGDDYITDTFQSLLEIDESKFEEVCDRLNNKIKSDDAADWNDRSSIKMLRELFAHLGLRDLSPDLIILDEFQRFREILNTEGNSDMALLVKEFFRSSSELRPNVLLMSATPYKAFTTLEELNETNCNDQYNDFITLMDFLFDKHSEYDFRKVWTDYSSALSRIGEVKFDDLIELKDKAEKVIYSAMCRTERRDTEFVDRDPRHIQVTKNDIMSYVQMQKFMDECRRLSNRASIPENVPVEYVKSSPYLLSFTEGYKLKKNIKTVFDNNTKLKLPFSKAKQTLLVNDYDLSNYNDISPNNARLDALNKEAFSNDSGLLLWVPASNPYYLTDESDVFARNKDFSKILVFSAWEMVPRMISFMLSYKSEQLVVPKAFGNVKYNSEAKWYSRINRDSVLFIANQFLCDLYNPKEYYHKRVHEIRRDLEPKIKDAIRKLCPNVLFEGKECNQEIVRQVADMLDNIKPGQINTDKISFQDKISENVITILANMAIGAPGICILRLFRSIENNLDVTERYKEDIKGLAHDTAKEFVNLFNKRQSTAILYRVFGKSKDKKHGKKAHKRQENEANVYYELVLNYCVMGNLQAVLDEYAYMIGGNADSISKYIMGSFIGIVLQDIDTYDSFANRTNEKLKVRTHFALRFNQVKNDEDKINHSADVRHAFNSPFYPFVLSTTSVGQEGLDFHWYCRKVMHWNLPSNPQDIEQREGRINRYQCLAIRRDVAKMFKEKLLSWHDMFEECKRELHEKYPKYNDIVPYWSLPSEWVKEYGEGIEKIERIVLLYPMSIDPVRYARIEKVLFLYRLTMGQPSQEVLLDYLGDNLSEAQRSRLLFDFSPSSTKHSSQDVPNTDPHTGDSVVE